MALRLDWTVSLSGRYDGVGDLGTPTLPISIVKAFSLASGIGSGQSDVWWSDTRTLALSATENIDLAGVLTDSFGAVATFAKVTGILVSALAANTNAVIVGGAASNAFVGPFGGTLGTQAIPPGGWWSATNPLAGWAVAAGTTDILKILNGGAGTAVTYDIIIVGRSA